MEKIAQGAEAAIHSDGVTVIKHRFEKTYRHPEIDAELRKCRTRREAKVIERLSEIEFPGPKLIEMDDKNMKIVMNHVKGELVKEVLHTNHRKLSREIGIKVGKLHSNNIVHGDLTTSNMILGNEIHFIDFGLSFFSEKEEDKAVDLHLLKQALESKHYKIFEECFDEAVKGYREECNDADKILKRLEIVESRGRNKKK